MRQRNYWEKNRRIKEHIPLLILRDISIIIFTFFPFYNYKKHSRLFGAFVCMRGVES